MSAPIAPGLDSIVDEALKKAGYSDVQVNNDNNLRTRAKDQWIEETKHDIWKLNKKLRSLYTTSIAMTTENQSRYPFPSDFESDLTITLLHGNINGTSQTSSSSTITLASTDGSGDEILGRQILIYEGTAIANMSQCISYDSTTKIADINPNWVTQPDLTSKYMIIDSFYPLSQKPIQNFDFQMSSHIQFPWGITSNDRGIPSFYYPIGDSDTGEFVFDRPSHSQDDIPFGMQLRYYADLLRVDLASELMTTLYRRWRNEFTQGILVRALLDKDDQNYQIELQNYGNMLRVLQGRETYGMDLTNLQQRVIT